MSKTESVFTLSQLSAKIASVFRQAFATSRFWVTAEIIGLKLSRGHCYLQLAEKDEFNVMPKAEFRGIIWASSYNRIHAKFHKETGRVLAEQMQILCCVEVQFHERYGLSLLVHEIDASYTLGQLELERRKTIELLTMEGIIHLNKELRLPEVVQRIAVISAEDSKGFEDFHTRLDNNPYGYSFHYTLYTSLLQGDLAAKDIIEKLDTILDDQSKESYDAVVIVRGGGGASSLECFNNYELAKAIAVFPMPVITGIGHTTDNSVVDEVAHIDLITPTEAAVFLMERMAEYEAHVLNTLDLIKDYALALISAEKTEFQQQTQAISTLINQVLVEAKHELEVNKMSIRHIFENVLVEAISKLQNHSSRLKFASNSLIQFQRSNLDLQKGRLPSLVHRTFKNHHEELINKETKTRLLDPIEVLKRGFSYTLYNGKLLQSANEGKLEGEITTILASGNIKSKITEINNG